MTRVKIVETPVIEFTVNGGIHDKGDCVVIHHGEIEIWVPLAQASALGTDILAEASKIKALNNRAIKRKTRGGRDRAR